MRLSIFDAILFEEEGDRLNDRREVGIHGLMDILHINLSNSFADRNCCVINEDMYFAVVLNDGLPCLVYLLLLAHVNLVEVDFFEFFSRLFAQITFEIGESFVWTAQYDYFDLPCIEIANQTLS